MSAGDCWIKDRVMVSVIWKPVLGRCETKINGSSGEILGPEAQDAPGWKLSLFSSFLGLLRAAEQL